MLCGLLIVGVVTGAVAEGELDALFGAIAATLVTGVITVRSALRLAMVKNAQREFDATHPQPGMPAVAAARAHGHAPEGLGRPRADAAAGGGGEGAGAGTGPAAGTAAPGVGARSSRCSRPQPRARRRPRPCGRSRPSWWRSSWPGTTRRTWNVARWWKASASLREQLDEGLDGYRSLVAAAGRVVAASSAAGPKQELTEATDHLAGLAVALRELSDAAG